MRSRGRASHLSAQSIRDRVCRMLRRYPALPGMLATSAARTPQTSGDVPPRSSTGPESARSGQRIAAAKAGKHDSASRGLETRRHWPCRDLARPGGNVTGLSLQQPDLGGKRLELRGFPRETVSVLAAKHIGHPNCMTSTFCRTNSARSRLLRPTTAKPPGWPRCKSRSGFAAVADFIKLIADETEKWAKVIRDANIKPD
jgi:hypothetical protein